MIVSTRCVRGNYIKFVMRTVVWEKDRKTQKGRMNNRFFHRSDYYCYGKHPFIEVWERFLGDFVVVNNLN